MEWKFDTGLVGECKSDDLRKILEAARDHFIKTQTAAAGEAVVRAAHDPRAPGAPALDVVKLGQQAQSASDAYAAKLAALREHMDAGLEAACKLADMFGGTVTATISGHDDPRHPSRCDQRIVIAVDQVWK